MRIALPTTIALALICGQTMARADIVQDVEKLVDCATADYDAAEMAA
jgi:hypothetical protein